MATVAFIGLGNMGGPMAANLVAAGHTVRGADMVPAACDAARQAGVTVCDGGAQAVQGAQAAILMLPAGRHVVAVMEEIAPSLSPDALVIDCSTIDIASARRFHEMAAAARVASVDAPVSGGVMGARNATLTFMCGGQDAALDRAASFLDTMGARTVRCGAPTAGQAAKVCNNMILAATMIVTGEAFEMGRRLGLDSQALFDVISTASGQSWSTTTYCPVPGPVPTSPANNDYKPGFAASLMVKDLTLAEEAANSVDARTPMGKRALELYRDFVENGGGDTDFSGIIKMLQDD